MHYHMEVYLKDSKNVDEQIEKLLAPYDENLEVEQYEEGGETYSRNPNGLWDWYQIGGRWTGSHDDYDPQKDKRNYERCSICGGTGFRHDSLGNSERASNPSYTCNGCGHCDFETQKWSHGIMGKGLALKFQSDWVRNFGDVIPVSEITEELSCDTMIVNENFFRGEIWDGNNWTKTGFDGKVKAKLIELGINSGYMVTVDFHS